MFSDIECRKIDLQQDFPINSNSADLVVLSETFEHLPDQHHFLKKHQEFWIRMGSWSLPHPILHHSEAGFPSLWRKVSIIQIHFLMKPMLLYNGRRPMMGTLIKFLSQAYSGWESLLQSTGCRSKIHKSQFTSTSFFYWFLSCDLVFSFRNLRKQIKNLLKIQISIALFIKLTHLSKYCSQNISLSSL